MKSTLIHIGAAPPNFDFPAQFFDGKSPALHDVRVSIDDAKGGTALRISNADGLTVEWPLNAVRRLPDQAGDDGLVLHREGDPLSRLILRDTEASAQLIARCPDIFRKPRVRGMGRIWGWSAAAVTAVGLIIFGLIPVMADQMANFLPPKGERALGKTTFEHIRQALSQTDFEPIDICDRSRSLAALAKMHDRLTADLDVPYPITLHVLDSPMINAFALPGGYVVLFRGLIEAAETPDELAAVIAHELGHVVARDPSRSALRSAGSIGVLGLLLGDFAGGAVVLFLAERLIDASYSQKAEQAADSFATALMAKAHIAPGALADMFARFEAAEAREDDADNGILTHFASHPQIRDRIVAARSEVQPGQRFAPSLSAVEWLELRMICGESYSF